MRKHQVAGFCIVCLLAILARSSEAVCAERKIGKNGAARIYIYRAPLTGTLWHPSVYLNGVSVWESETGEVGVLDVAAGTYECTTSDNDKKLRFSVYPGETKYINLVIRAGIWSSQIIPQFQNRSFAEMHINGLELRSLKWNTNQ